MNNNYLKIAWRVLLKNKTHALINIVGLGLGLSLSILMLIYVHHLLSYDTFHHNSDRIYRFTINGSMNDGKQLTAAITAGDVEAEIRRQVPGVERIARVYSWGGNDVIINEKRFTDDEVYWVDNDFLSMMNFPLVSGNKADVLTEPNTLVISQSTALKYFGSEDVVGKVLKMGGTDYKINGVVEDVPASSHLQFDMLASFSTLDRFNVVENNGLSFPTYMLLQENADAEVVKSQVVKVADDFVNKRFQPLGITIMHDLQPLLKIYLHSGFSYDVAEYGDIRNVYIFSFLALLVIIIALFNFINLLTSQSEKRTREIGLRKVLGATRRDLIIQFIGESVLITFFAFLFALLLNELLISTFSNLLDEDLSLAYWTNPVLMILVFLFVLVIGVFAGFYPAFYMSKFQPALVLRGLPRGSSGKSRLRQSLVLFQFVVSVFLVVTMLLLGKQVNYMKNIDPGFDRENVISVNRITRKIHGSYESLKADLQQIPGVVSVTASENIPGTDRSVQNGFKKGEDPSQAVMIMENRVQHGYLQTYGITLVQGRDFDPSLQTDTAAIIINETAVEKLGLSGEIIGQVINIWQHQGPVIGVMKNYNFMSLHNEIDPLALTMYESWFTRISIRYRPENAKHTLDAVREVFESADPNYEFQYTMVDDLFARMYAKEERVNRLVSFAALLAVLISFMGLYALTSFNISKRVKEIGIRKVMGASVQNIMALLFRDLTRWIVAGNLIAWPLAWYAVMRWNENFAFRIHIPEFWYLFLVAGALAAIVGIFATMVQAVAAAHANPVDSIKNE
ncbi:MAG: ABC transporter permease [Bacteroidota bacterium]